MYKTVKVGFVICQVVCVSISCVSAFAAERQGEVLAQNKTEESLRLTTIVTPPQRGKTISFAARELARYFKLMTGVDYEIADEDDGDSHALIRLEVDTRLNHDGYRIYRDGLSICISGGSPRGCLYGAYTLLGDLGCRWPLPGKEYEVVPKLKQISWPGPTIQSAPSMAGRGITFYPSNALDETLELLDWMAKNRFNFLFLHENHARRVPAEILPKLKEAFAVRDMGLEWGGHWLTAYLPRSLFKEHPEYFRMENGKRTDKLNMCPSNPEVADFIAKNPLLLGDWGQVRDFPRLESLGLFPDDLWAGGWCSCEQCKGLTESDQALKILNEVARRLPLGDTTLLHAVYHASLSAPKNIRPDDNIRLDFGARERCYKHAMDECALNRRYLEYLEGQIQMFPNKPAAFEYYHDMILFRNLPMPLHPIIGKDVKVYRRAGAVRLSSLCFRKFSKLAYGPNHYVLGKCLWRGDGDPEDMKEYCDAVYGPHAKVMKEYFDVLFEFCGTVMQLCGYEVGADMRNPPIAQPYTKTHVALLAPLVTPEHLDGIESLLKDAIAGAEEPYQGRMQNALLVWSFARVEVQAIYETILGGYLINNLGQEATDIDRLYIIAILKKAVQDLDTGNEILRTANEELGGGLDHGMVSSRLNFKGNPLAWIQSLEKQMKVTTEQAATQPKK